MATTFDVWHEHQVLKSYPLGTPYEVTDTELRIGGDLYRAGEWSWAGRSAVCAFITPDENCPNCYPPELETDPDGA